jgi:hypothetical protein
LFFGDPVEQEAKLLLLVLAESPADSGVVFARNATDLFHHPLAGCGQVQGVHAPIPSIRAAFDEAPLLQLIQQSDQTTGQDLKAAAEFLLAEAGRHADHSENTCVRAA